ncbi:MAG: hypothetical protein ACW98X_23515 [Promethearchaeota archaeon]|jgi:hypothetical protein
MILYKKDFIICYEDTADNNKIKYVYNAFAEFEDAGSGSILISIYRFQGRSHKNFFRAEVLASTITNRLGVAYGTTVEDVIFGFNLGMDTNWQDQTTDPIIVKFNKVANSTTLASAAAIEDKTITLTSATGAADGKYIVLFHPGSERFSTFQQVGAAAGAVITLDSEVDFAYPAGTFVDIADTNLAVDGSSTTQVFGLRGTGAPPGVDITFDCTRIIMSCLTDSAVSLAEFASIPALTNGLQLRERNGRYKNIWNIKTNREIDAIFGTDWKAYAATNPSQGQDGFTARLTFSGPEKMGVAVRLPIGTDLEILVQDDLTAVTQDIQLLEVFAEGHITEP